MREVGFMVCGGGGGTPGGGVGGHGLQTYTNGQTGENK